MRNFSDPLPLLKRGCPKGGGVRLSAAIVFSLMLLGAGCVKETPAEPSRGPGVPYPGSEPYVSPTAPPPGA